MLRKELITKMKFFKVFLRKQENGELKKIKIKNKIDKKLI